MKLKIILTILLVLSILSGIILFSSWQTERAARIRNENNVTILANNYKNDTSFLKQQILLMTKKEVKNSFPQYVELVKKEFGAKLNDIYQVASTQMEVNHTFKTTIKDSFNTIIDTVPLQYMKYKDAYIDFEAQKVNDDAYVTKNINRVPLLQVVHEQKPGKWKPKNILPWHWRKKELIQDIKSENPYVKIEYSQIIQLVK